MSKMSRFRGTFDKTHGKGDQTLFESEQYHLYHIYWSVSGHWSWKKFLLVICKVLRMFVNIWTADDKCFLINRDKLRQKIQMHVSEKQKTFSQFFSSILKSRLNFRYFWKKMSVIAELFPKLRTRKRWLKKCQKSPASKDHSTSNMVRGNKHFWNLNRTTFTIFTNHCLGNWAGKSPA